MQVAAHERLSTGQPNLTDAAPNKDQCETRDLLKTQDLTALQELIIRPEDLLWHAIHTAEIAAVGDGDAQVAQWAVKGVGEHHLVLLDIIAFIIAGVHYNNFV